MSVSYYRAMSPQCSVDCLGDSCQSIHGYEGVCLVEDITTELQCEVYEETYFVTTLWFNGSVCLLPSASQEDCNKVPLRKQRRFS
jgi:hypothetical protein